MKNIYDLSESPELVALKKKVFTQLTNHNSQENKINEIVEKYNDLFSKYKSLFEYLEKKEKERESIKTNKISEGDDYYEILSLLKQQLEIVGDNVEMKSNLISQAISHSLQLMQKTNREMSKDFDIKKMCNFKLNNEIKELNALSLEQEKKILELRQRNLELNLEKNELEKMKK